MEIKKKVEDFIRQHLNSNTAEVALKLAKLPDYPKDYILNQINGRQKAKKKYPFLLDAPGFVFPPKRAIEQSSSAATASYKANLLATKTVLDLSGGMGIDAYFFSKSASAVTYIDMNPALVAISVQNFNVLGSTNITSICAKAEEFLENTNQQFDLIYIDPDRRVAKTKAFKIDECEPNVAQLLPHIWNRSEYCLLKLSPMLDITQALSELNFCQEIHVVALQNDCKELLFQLKRAFDGNPVVKCINLKQEGTEYFEFDPIQESQLSISFDDPQQFLYEPNVAVLKAGAFKSIAAQFGLKKLAPHTHLYTSKFLVKDFPGRTIEINSVEKPQKKLLDQANVICRNFPLGPEELKKKYKIKDGGTTYLYACSLRDSQKCFVLGNLIQR